MCEGGSSEPFTVKVKSTIKWCMEVDTDTAVTLMAVETQKWLFLEVSLKKCTLKLQTYTAERLRVVGKL